jgi:hypothetical protein
VCVYVCTYVCMYVLIYVYVCMYVCMRNSDYIRLKICAEDFESKGDAVKGM